MQYNSITFLSLSLPVTVKTPNSVRMYQNYLEKSFLHITKYIPGHLEVHKDVTFLMPYQYVLSLKAQVLSASHTFLDDMFSARQVSSFRMNDIISSSLAPIFVSF